MDEPTISRRTLLAAAAGAVGSNVLPQPVEGDGGRRAGGGATTHALRSELDPRLSAALDAKNYGAKGDGVTDDTAAIQAMIDAGKGKTVTIPDGTFIHAGLFLSGASYNGTTIVCQGELELRPRVGAETTFGGAFVGLVIKDCDNVTLYYRGHGNRTNQTDNQECHLVGIAGATNLHVPTFHAREVRGDGLYVGQSDWLSRSRVPSHIELGQVIVTNSTDDGRNAISVISVDGMLIDSLISYRVGGVVQGGPMPGGLDIEPNFSYQTVTDVVVHNLHVISAGALGFAVQGQPITNPTVGDWNITRVTIGNAVVRLTGPTGFALCKRAFDVKANVTITASGPLKQGLLIDDLERANIKLVVRGPSITNGLNVGHHGWVSDFAIDVDVYGYSVHGLEVCGARRGTFVGRVYGATSGSSTFAILTRSNGRALTQTDITYSVDAPYDGKNARAFRNEPSDAVTFAACRWENSDLTGYVNFPSTFENLGPGITKANLAGVTDGTTPPANGMWNTGDMVLNKAPIPGASTGWVCVAAGSPGTWNRFGFIALDNAAPYDPPSLAPGAGATTTLKVDGAALGDHAGASFSLDLQGLTLTAYVSGADTVSVRFLNGTAGAVNLSSGTVRVRVTKL